MENVKWNGKCCRTGMGTEVRHRAEPKTTLNKNTMLTRKTRKHRNEVPVVGKEKNKNKLYHLLKVRNLYKLYIKNQGHCV